MSIGSYKDLIVWQKAMDLSFEIYRLTESFPPDERFGLTSQMRRAAVSIPSNIAEGKMRGYDGEFARFLSIAYGSGAELETQVLIAKRLLKTNQLDYAPTDGLLDEVMRMLNTLSSSPKG